MEKVDKMREVVKEGMLIGSTRTPDMWKSPMEDHTPIEEEKDDTKI